MIHFKKGQLGIKKSVTESNKIVVEMNYKAGPRLREVSALPRLAIALQNRSTFYSTSEHVHCTYQIQFSYSNLLLQKWRGSQGIHRPQAFSRGIGGHRR